MTFHRYVLISMLAVASACGISTSALDVDTPDDSLEAEGEGLSSTKDTYIIVRRDVRRCIAPLCGGYWVKDLNSTAQERYVSAFDFSLSDIPADTQSVLTASPDYELVVYGRLGPKERQYNTRTLIVKLAYRGLPGNTFLATDKFYGVFPTKIACITQPCAYLQTTRLNRTTGHTMASGFDFSNVLEPFVDEQWLLGRAYSGRTIIAGKIVRKDGAVTVTAQQVFVQLPDRVVPCEPPATVACTVDEVPYYSRSPNRCNEAAGCGQPRFCAAYVPACSPGYRHATWSAGCTMYACEPEFLEP